MYSSTTSRHLVRRCWTNIATAETAVAILVSMSLTRKTRISEARRQFGHLTTTGIYSFPYRQQVSPRFYPKAGQSSLQQNLNIKSTFGGGNVQIRTVFIQTKTKPNPESIKFLLSNTVRTPIGWLSKSSATSRLMASRPYILGVISLPSPNEPRPSGSSWGQKFFTSVLMDFFSTKGIKARDNQWYRLPFPSANIKIILDVSIVAGGTMESLCRSPV